MSDTKRVLYRCTDCGHQQYVTHVLANGREYAGSGSNWCDECSGLPVRVEMPKPAGPRLPTPDEQQKIVEAAEAMLVDPNMSWRRALMISTAQACAAAWGVKLED